MSSLVGLCNLERIEYFVGAGENEITKSLSKQIAGVINIALLLFTTSTTRRTSWPGRDAHRSCSFVVDVGPTARQQTVAGRTETRRHRVEPTQ